MARYKSCFLLIAATLGFINFVEVYKKKNKKNGGSLKMNNSKMNDSIFAVFGVACVIGLIIFLAWAWPTYRVWSSEMAGRAELARAEWNRQIIVEEAQAWLEAERLNAQAEIIRAEGMAEAMRIEGGQYLTETYIRYLWAKAMMNNRNLQIIYIPTEAGLPILEARGDR